MNDEWEDINNDDEWEDVASPSSGTSKPKSISETFQKHFDRLAYGAREPVEALAQGLRNTMPEGMSNAIGQLDPMLHEATGGFLGHKEPNLNKWLQQEDERYNRELKPEGFDYMRVGGNVAAAIPMSLANIPRTVAGAAASGGISGLLQPVYDAKLAEDPLQYAKEKALQAGMGAGTGAVMNAATKPFLGGVKLQDGVDELRRAGVNPTVGQALGGMFDNLEQKAQSMPIVGDAIRVSRQKARDEFNNATINRVLDPIGAEVNGHGTTAVHAAQNAIDSAYEAAKGRVKDFIPDYTQAAQSRVVDTMNNAGRKEYEGLVAKLTKGSGGLDATRYKVLDSDLANLSSTYGSSTSAQDKLIGNALGDFRANLKGQLAATSPELGDMMRNADRAHAGMVRVDRAANAAGLHEGVFTPGQLVNAVKATDRSARRQAFAGGEAMLQDWAVNGQKVLGDVYPDSGTAGRILGMGGTAAGLAAYQPHTLMTMLMASAGAHPKAQKAIIDAISRNRGRTSSVLDELLPYTSGGIDRELR